MVRVKERQEGREAAVDMAVQEAMQMMALLGVLPMEMY